MWLALLNRPNFEFSFTVLFIRIRCTGSVQYPVKVARHFHRTLNKCPLRWRKNVPQPLYHRPLTDSQIPTLYVTGLLCWFSTETGGCNDNVVLYTVCMSSMIKTAYTQYAVCSILSIFIHYTLYTAIHYTLYTAIHYTLYTAIHYTLYTIHYTLYSAIHYTLYIIHYTLLYTIHYTLLYCYTLYTAVHCYTLYTAVHCYTLYTIHCYTLYVILGSGRPHHIHQNISDHDHGSLVVGPGSVQGLQEVTVQRIEHLCLYLVQEVASDDVSQCVVQPLTLLVQHQRVGIPGRE